MIKYECETYGKIYELGFFQINKWNRCDRYLPEKPGKYLISNKRGEVKLANFANSERTISTIIFDECLDEYTHEPIIIWSDRKVVTAHDLVKVCFTEKVWYMVDTSSIYDEPVSEFIFFTDEDKPVYWMNLFSGPTEEEKAPIHRVNIHEVHNIKDAEDFFL